MNPLAPKVVILAGPNGAGKSTSAPKLLRGALAVDEFVNADTIAQGLSAFAPDRVALQAGRIMLTRLAQLAAANNSFGFETTLASRTYAPWLRKLRATGYRVHLTFLWLSSPDEAVARVAERVRAGGHDVPEATIRRRYDAGLRNLVQLYVPLADSWQVLNNSGSGLPSRIAAGSVRGAAKVHDPLTWRAIQEKVYAP
ncbi:MAG TPA: AAA family ATPase [Pirellulales bacterium]|nr:AAA family ATPase [Pirellulales bacterium]